MRRCSTILGKVDYKEIIGLDGKNVTQLLVAFSLPYLEELRPCHAWSDAKIGTKTGQYFCWISRTCKTVCMPSFDGAAAPIL
jgi:hypothetical protein